MAIGRVSGPMLFADLERQGLDLSIDGNLIYFDVNLRRIGINTSTPGYDLHVEGTNGNPATVWVSGNVVGNTLVVANAYALTTTSGNIGDLLASDGIGGTYWARTALGIERKKFNYLIDDFPSGAVVDFDMDLGISSIVYALTVSRPCLVEVFATKAKDETNPYTFIATLDHLTDDGRVLLDDGSVIQQRQYSIFANQEEPAENRVYARVTNIDGVGGPLELNLTYFPAVTDNRAGIYDMNVVDSLPDTGYSGQTVMLKSDKKLYVWFDDLWNPVS